MKNNMMMLLCYLIVGCASRPPISDNSAAFETAFWKLHVGDPASSALDLPEKPISTSSYTLNGRDYDHSDFEHGAFSHRDHFSMTVDKTKMQISSLLYEPLWLSGDLSVDNFLKARNLPAQLDQIIDECTHHISVAYLYEKDIGLFIQYRINRNSIEHVLFLNADSFDRELTRLKHCSHGAKVPYTSNPNVLAAPVENGK